MSLLADILMGLALWLAAGALVPMLLWPESSE